MKIYLCFQNVNNGCDTHDAIVVVAESEDDARTINPSGDPFEDKGGYTDWVHNTADIKVEEIGEANPNQQRGVILASFNAG